MTEIILHHYGISPFAEKVRLALGHKQLAWRSVDIPVVMPKPDLLALTGGYRKTPVLQIENHIYCDTWLIGRLLDALHPTPPLFDPALMGVGAPAARWFDRELFFGVFSQWSNPTVAAAGAEALGGGAQAVAFAEDRRRMMTAARLRPPRVDEGRVIVAQALQQLDRQLAHAGPFLMGQTLSWVDLCAYHPLWSLQSNRALAPQLEGHTHVRKWLERVRACGHGEQTPMSSAEALHRARDCAVDPPMHSPEQQLAGLSLGQQVDVSAADYALEPTTGILVLAAADELAIERRDERAGRVIVHFPRTGYRITAHVPSSEPSLR